MGEMQIDSSVPSWLLPLKVELLGRLGALDTRLAVFETRLEGIDVGVEKINVRLDKQNGSIAKATEKLAAHEVKFISVKLALSEHERECPIWADVDRVRTELTAFKKEQHDEQSEVRVDLMEERGHIACDLAVADAKTEGFRSAQRDVRAERDRWHSDIRPLVAIAVVLFLALVLLNGPVLLKYLTLGG